MKTLYNILLGMFVGLSFLFVSCDDNYMETDLENQPLVLSVSESTIVLDITAPQSSVVDFEWTPGSNFNTNAAITYTFELSLGNTHFANSVSKELNEGKTSISYKTEELNAILLNEFNVVPGIEVELEAQVTATVHHDDIQPQVSETVKIKVTGYRPVSSILYLIGSAAPNGWSADNATKMNTVSGVAGGFVWQGKLNAGELKFITTLGQFLPSYGKGADDTKVYFRESDNDPDEKFIIPTAGVYRISINIINLAIHIEALDAPEFSELWVVGNPTGWNFQPMRLDESDPFVFHYNADLSTGGEFKIGTVAGSWDAVFFRPVVDQTPEGANQNVEKWAGGPDNKWNIIGGVYKIKLDTREMKIDILPFTPYTMIYLVGDATPNGWSIDNATPLIANVDPYTFTWTGTLNEGDMKFTCDKKNDWNGDWFLASENGKEPTGEIEQMLFSSPGSNPDNKWKINDAGTYTIELNQLQETVIIKKQ